MDKGAVRLPSAAFSWPSGACGARVGMETTVKVACGDTMLTSVVFGSVDYAIDAPIRVSITGEGIALFDKASGNSVANGSVKML